MKRANLHLNACKEKEAEINRKLARLSPDYSISRLRLQPNGKFAFDLKCAFAPEDLDEVRKVFQGVLAGFKEGERKEQTKVYLSPKARQKLKELAHVQGATQSAIVERCILELAKNTAKEKPQEAEVVAVGPGVVGEDGKQVKKGDRILIEKFAGTEVKIEGKEYIIMREDDVLAIIGASGGREAERRRKGDARSEGPKRRSR